jgi:hypothetical protein
VLCCAVLCCAVLWRAVICCAVLCCAVLCCAVLRCDLLRCAALHCAVCCCAQLRESQTSRVDTRHFRLHAKLRASQPDRFADSWRPTAVLQVLLSVPASEVGPRLEALAASLGISCEGARALVRDHPRFLFMAPATLEAAWVELRRAASMRAEWREQIGGWTASTLSRYVVPFGR